jgi:hypothetical protein
MKALHLVHLINDATPVTITSSRPKKTTAVMVCSLETVSLEKLSVAE